MPSAYPLVLEASKHCWNKNYLEVFREFCTEHANKFENAPADMSTEQNLEHYALFQEYLTLYENTLSSYIKSLEVSVEEFYSQLVEVKNDSNIKDKKLLHFVNYLLASTDYAAFYKIMVRAARKARKGEQVVSFSTKADSKYESPHNSRADSKSGDFKLCEAKLDSK